MIRWGVVLILFGIFAALFLGAPAGGQLVDVGKWLVLVGAVLAVVFAVFNGRSGSDTIV